MRYRRSGARTTARALLGFGLIGVLLCGCGRLFPLPPPGTPQTLSGAELMGTWTDGRGGSLTFSDGHLFVADKICGDYLSMAPDAAAPRPAASRPAATESTASGSTAPEPPGTADEQIKTGYGPWEADTSTAPGERVAVTKVRIEFDGELAASYEAGGTRGAPRLWAYLGDPDDGDLCVLTKT
ncbi:hypothetical protein [Streptomyces sp. NBC_00096]|uniref:hypothetical protein n=1 Tax=Streptomyces sp. NBC_00096 TaxID=2975650 RepID=UPI0032532266